MNIERKIVIGLITSTEFLQQIAPAWDANLLEARASQMVATWCIEYFDKYDKAPGKDIQTIFKTKERDLEADVAQDIEEDFLPSLDQEYLDEPVNLDYLLDQARAFFKERHLENHSELIQGLVMDGELLEAEKLASEYAPLAENLETTLDLSKDHALSRIDKAFDQTTQSLIYYPRALGKLWNRHLRRGAFVALMGPEKSGKTFWLWDMSARASKGGYRVAFFQAGDMTEDEMLVRGSVHLSGRSNLKEYSGKMWQPEYDCVKNQLNTCVKEVRECQVGVFEELTERELRDKLTLDDILEARTFNKEYRACRNCSEYWNKRGFGSPWMKRVDTGDPLTVEEAKAMWKKFFTGKRPFKLSSHINNTLTIKEIKANLDIWERQDGFVPDVITIDYADLLVPDVRMEYRHQQNEIWKSLRGLSQERHCLVLTATQADAKSYDKRRLSMANFSEDKRKFGHVTAMWGLNQEKDDREKDLKLMRINELVKREGSIRVGNEVTVLQNLERGKPFLGSFWT